MTDPNRDATENDPKGDVPTGGAPTGQPTWDQLEAVFFAALRVPSGELDEFLTERCSGDLEMRAEVEAMLMATERDEGLGMHGTVLSSPKTGDPSRAGERMGRYRLLSVLGQGGMGTVYLAERADGVFEQKVAVKLLKRDLYSRESRRRFEAERDILAKMTHPNIARLLDGGTAQDGQPYLVMEAVDGISINRYCEKNRLTVDQRIRLFIDVAETVHFAHQNLVVHRDLKPSNIMVTDSGGIRLLDFGIAKLLDESGLGHASVGTMEVRALTPDRAAPEQIRGEMVTTATDVYGLGLLLFELLCGRLPFHPSGTNWAEAASAVLSGEATPLSQTLSGGDPAVETEKLATPSPLPNTVAYARRTTVNNLRKKLQGDLEIICQKAIHREPGHRYASAQQLVEDLEHHLNHEPIIARRDALGHRIRKFVRRHRTSVAAGVALAISSVGLGSATIYQAKVARTERDHARVEEQRSAEVVEILVGLFAASNPRSNAGFDTLTVTTFLAQTEEGLLEDLADQPGALARILTVLGSIRSGRDELDAAKTLLTQALELQLNLTGEEHPDYAEIFFRLALVRQRQDGLAGLPMLEEGVALVGRQFGDSSEDFSKALLELAARTESPEERLALIERSMAIKRELVEEFGPTRSLRTGLANGLNSLGVHYFALGRLNDALDRFEECLVVLTELFPENHHNVLQVSGNVAVILGALGEVEAATVMREGMLESRRRLNPGPDGAVANDLSQLGTLAASVGHLEAADSLLSESLAMWRILGTGSRGAQWVMQSLATVRRRRGITEGTRRMMDEAIQLGEGSYGSGSLHVLQLRRSRAGFIGKTDPDAAADSLALFLEAIKALAPPEGDGNLADTQRLLGGTLLRLGRFSESRPLLRSALTFYTGSLPPDHEDILLAQALLGLVMLELDNREQAADLLRPSYQGVLDRPAIDGRLKERIRDAMRRLR